MSKITRKEAQGLAVLAMQYLRTTRPDLDAKGIRVIASTMYRLSK